MGLSDLTSDRSSVDAFFIGALVVGFLLSLSTFWGRAKGLPLRFRARMAEGLLRAKPWLGPTLALTLTAFGLSGLGASGTGAPSAMAVLAAALAALVCSLAAAGLFRRFMSDGGEPLNGQALIGAVGTVSLAIPEQGVGRVTYVAEGQRRVLPARTHEGTPLLTGSRVIVEDVKAGVAIVEEL